MRKYTCRPLLPAVLAFVLAVVVAAPAAGAGEDGATEGGGTVGIALLEAPADRATDPRALVYVIDHLNPGDVIERRIAVTNSTGGPVPVDLYAGASEITQQGWAPLDGRASNDLTTWTTITPDATTVPAGGSVDGTIRIVVPDDAISGEHYAVAWAQLPVEPGGTVDVVHRVGIRMYLSVGEGSEPASDFAIDSAAATVHEDGSRSLDVTVTNTGGRALDLSGEATLSAGPAGTTAGPFRTPSGPTLAPGDTGVLSLPVPAELPDGTWNAQIIVRSGALERRAEAGVSWSDPVDAVVAATPVGDGDGGGTVEVDRSFGDAGALAVSVFALALLLAVAAAAARTHRRHRRLAVQQ